MKIALRTTNSHGLKALFSILTKWRLQTVFPHGGIVLGNTLTHATLVDGVNEVTFDPAGWLVYDYPAVNDQAAYERLDKFNEAKYDVFALLAFVLPWRISDSRRVYCFELMWAAMTGENPSFKVTPEMILAKILENPNPLVVNKHG